MPERRHCRHCTGDCLNTCLIGDSGLCLHGWDRKPPGARFRVQLLMTRRFWHRVFWGVG